MEESRLALRSVVESWRLVLDSRRRPLSPIGHRPSGSGILHGTRWRPCGTGGLNGFKERTQMREHSSQVSEQVRGPTLPRPTSTTARARQPPKTSPPGRRSWWLSGFKNESWVRASPPVQAKTATAAALMKKGDCLDLFPASNETPRSPRKRAVTGVQVDLLSDFGGSSFAAALHRLCHPPFALPFHRTAYRVSGGAR